MQIQIKKIVVPRVFLSRLTLWKQMQQSLRYGLLGLGIVLITLGPLSIIPIFIIKGYYQGLNDTANTFLPVIRWIFFWAFFFVQLIAAYLALVNQGRYAWRYGVVLSVTVVIGFILFGMTGAGFWEKTETDWNILWKVVGVLYGILGIPQIISSLFVSLVSAYTSKKLSV